MRRRKRATAALVCSVMVLSLLTTTAAPAGAVPFAAVRFSCTMHLAQSPTVNGGSAACVGEVTGVGALGAPLCLPACDFLAALHDYSETCFAGEPALVGFYSGDIFVGGVRIGDFDWLRVGTKLYFVTPGTARGEGVYIPRPPIPTCDNPGPLTVDIHGRLHAI